MSKTARKPKPSRTSASPEKPAAAEVADGFSVATAAAPPANDNDPAKATSQADSGPSTTDQTLAEQTGPPPAEPPECVASSMMVPHGDVDAGYCSTQLASTRLTRRQAAAFKRLFCTLRDKHEKVAIEGRAAGKVVEDQTHTLRWLGDRLANLYEAADLSLEDNPDLTF